MSNCHTDTPTQVRNITCVAVAEEIAAPLALRALSTYARSLSAVCTGPEGGMQLLLALSGIVPAGQSKHRLYSLPLSCMLLSTLVFVMLVQLHTPAADNAAGVQAAVMEKPLPKLESFPVVESHETQLS